MGFPKSLNSLQQHLNMSKVTLNFNWEHSNFFPRASSQIGLGNCGCSLEGECSGLIGLDIMIWPFIQENWHENGLDGCFGKVSLTMLS
jgi:hypothetical protein